MEASVFRNRYYMEFSKKFSNFLLKMLKTFLKDNIISVLTTRHLRACYERERERERATKYDIETGSVGPVDVIG
jgi:hypothetical protein